MSQKLKETEVDAVTFKNESARLRWELFHRAIAHAKQSNLDAMEDRDGTGGDGDGRSPLLSLVR